MAWASLPFRLERCVKVTLSSATRCTVQSACATLTDCALIPLSDPRLLPLSQLLGARVIAAGSDDTKLAVVRSQAGADELVNYAKSDLREKVVSLRVMMDDTLD